MVPIVALPSAIYWRTSDIGVGDDQRQRPGLYAANPDSIVVPHAMRSDENVVVRDRRFELQQEVFVFGIVSGSLRVRAREPFDLFDGSPERYRQEMRPLTLDPAQHVHTPIPFRRPVIGDAGFAQVVEVLLGLRRPGYA